MANHRSGHSKRAALKQQQELEDRRRRNSRILGFGLAGVGIVVLVILALVIVQTVGQGRETAAGQQTPPNATAGHGIEKVSRDVAPAADAPHVIVYEDFQCPACADREAVFGPAFASLIDSGDITFEVRYATFMEDNLGNGSSTNAARAAAAADAVGKFREFHTHVYSQLSETGAGFTKQQLRVDFPAAVGITGDDLAKFQELYDSQAFAQFVEDSHAGFKASGITGTPTFLVGDVALQFYDEDTREVLIQPTPEDLLRAITEAAG